MSDIPLQPIVEKNEKNKEVHQYGVEMDNLMSIIINSMYSSKEYFLRELISNSSDACDKLNVVRTELRDKNFDLETSQKIKIHFGENSLTIEDNGIGMNKEELVKFLGCVANSGTRKFREAVKNKENVDQLIGQFGLGFYASFLVADHVDVVSKRPDSPAYLWSSTGLGSYSVSEVETSMTHGTQVVLHLKDGCKEFLQKDRITELIKKYSMFIHYPIVLLVREEIKKEEKKDEETKEEENKEEKVTEEKSEEEKKEEEKKEEEKETAEEEKQFEIKEELINKEKPLWSMKPNQITKEMYSSFYKAISNDWDDYLSLKHSHLEGSVSFDVLLFAPKRPPFNMFSTDKKKKTIKLYCSGVFVTDDLDLPEWMQMVNGVISSTDLPINVSREFLQGNNVRKLIRKTLVKKTIELLQDMCPETYDKFYKEFSSMVKLAVRDETNSAQWEKLLRFSTNKRENISLNDYVLNMKENQKDIYIITGTSREEVDKSPFVQIFKDYEIIFMIDAIDEYLLQKLRKFEGKELVKINQEGIELPNTEISEEMNKSLEPLKSKILAVLDGQVEKVEFKNLNDKHMIVQTPKYSISPAMEKILAAQVSLDKSNMFMFPKGKKILQVNVSHPLTFKMNSLLDKEAEFTDLVKLLFTVSCIQCGYSLEDPVGFSDLVISALGNEFEGFSGSNGFEGGKVEEQDEEVV